MAIIIIIIIRPYNTVKCHRPHAIFVIINDENSKDVTYSQIEFSPPSIVTPQESEQPKVDLDTTADSGTLTAETNGEIGSDYTKPSNQLPQKQHPQRNHQPPLRLAAEMKF